MNDIESAYIGKVIGGVEFDGIPIEEYEDPIGGKIDFVFYTERGSKYVVSENGMSQRIRYDDDVPMSWMDEIYFSEVPVHKTMFFDYMLKMFDWCPLDYEVKQSFRLCGYSPSGLSMNLKMKKVFDDSETDWVNLYSFNGQFKKDNPMSEKEAYERAIRSNSDVILKNISLVPMIGYSVAEFRFLDKASRVVKVFHPGHKITKIEYVRGDINEIEKKRFSKCNVEN
jgi:hypothetical protein